MKNSEIRDLSTEELHEKLGEERANLVKQKFTHAVSAIENPNVIKNTRKVIARIITELNTRDNQETAAESN